MSMVLARPPIRLANKSAGSARKQAQGKRMGYVELTIKVENYGDRLAVQNSNGKPKKKAQPVRAVIIPDALVDTGTLHLCLPVRYIKQLGLHRHPGTLKAQTANGYVERRTFGGAWLTIQDRSDEFTVVELPDSAPTLIGVVPLEVLDFIVDPTEQKLIGKHGKQRVCLMY